MASPLRVSRDLHVAAIPVGRFQFTLGRLLIALAFFGAALSYTPRVNDLYLGAQVLGFACGGIVGALTRGPLGAVLGACIGIAAAAAGLWFPLALYVLLVK
jgi:hypothetical protein